MRCLNCNKEFNDDYAFCPHCGAKNEPPVEPEPEILICSNCGFDLDPQTWHMELHQYGADKYCPKCGRKMYEDKGVLEQLAEKQNNLLATNKAWSDAIEKNGYVN